MREENGKNRKGAMDCGGPGSATFVCLCLTDDEISSLPAQCSSSSLSLSPSLGQVGWEDVIIANVRVNDSPPPPTRLPATGAKLIPFTVHTSNAVNTC